MKAPKAFQKTIETVRANHLIFFTSTLVALAILIFYWQDFSILANEALQSESASHTLLVPFLAAYLLYQKRDIVKASVSLERLREAKSVSLHEIIGFAVCLSAFLLYWYGSSTFYPLEYHLASLPLLIVGTTVALFGRKTLMLLIPPILFLAFLVPPPSIITYTAGGAIGNLNTQISYTALRAAGLPVTLLSEYGSPTIVLANRDGQSISFAVDVPCSGIYSLIAFTMFAAFLALIIGGSLFKKAGLFVLGFGILIVLNIVRIMSIVFVGHRFGEEVAMTLFHTVSGWVLIFVGILLLLFIGDRFLNLKLFSSSKEPQTCVRCGELESGSQEFCPSCGRLIGKRKLGVSKRSMTKVVALLLGCTLATLSIQAPVFAFAQGSIFANQNWIASNTIFPELPGYGVRFLYRDVDYERISHQDASLLFAYMPLNTSNLPIYVLVGVADSMANLHNWEVCLVSYQVAHGESPLVSVLGSRDIQLIQNPSIIARYFVFRSPDNYTQFTLYWYEKALFNTGTTVHQKYVRTSLIVLAQTEKSSTELEEKLLALGKRIAEYWEPLKEQSLISIGIPLQQSLLVGAVGFAAITGATQFTSDKRKKARNLKLFRNFASSDEKQLLQTIQELGKGKGATLEAIHQAFTRGTKKKVEPEELTTMLKSLEKYGIIQKEVTRDQNSLKLIWKF